LRSVFFGTSDFAVPSLRVCASLTDCRLVVTQPDRPAGRGHKLQPTPVKRVALELGIPTLEPARLRDALEALRACEADVFALASYGKIVPQAVLDLPPLGALNVHPSLLPLYRGATPLQAQLRDGVTQGGVTIMLMDAGLDTGDIVLQRETAIGPDEIYGELHDRLATGGAAMLAEVLALAARGPLPREAQTARGVDPARIAATATRPLEKADLEIDWAWSARRIADHVRSLSPAPGARAELGGERVKLLRVSVRDGAATAAPGTLLDASGDAALVACGDGVVGVERLVPPNRGPLDGAAFARARAAV
jgi:methionyl-tRNA formyltransferase